MIRVMQGVIAVVTVVFLLALAFVVIGQEDPTLNDWRLDANAWLDRYRMPIDRAAVWTLSIAFGVYMLANFGIWWMLRRQRDRSDVGRALKLLKLTQAMMGLGLGLLFSIALWVYYTTYRFTELQELLIAAFVVVTVVVAALMVVVLGVVLWRDNRIMTRATDVRQDEREVTQNLRETEQGQRSDRQQRREDDFDDRPASDL